MSKERLESRADKAASEWCLSIGLCEHCGRDDAICQETLVPHHVEHRDEKRTRCKPYNLICLCFQCHTFAHEERKQFDSWFKKTFPENWDAIQARKQDPEKHDYAKDIEWFKSNSVRS